jgi:hypothetical protein
VVIINFTSSSVFLTALIMALTKDNFGMQPLSYIPGNHREL